MTYWRLRSYLPKDHPLKALELGSEESPAEYVANMVKVFRLVREAMADHATFWVNVGDSYNGYYAGHYATSLSAKNQHARQVDPDGHGALAKNLEAGQLCLIPWRLAIALQDDGWLVRSVVVWHKPACMPSSVSGWLWKRCRVKVQSMRTTTQGYAQAGNHRDKKHGDLNKQPSAEWADCHGCKKCEPNHGYVLRRGSWRPTNAWEPVLMLAKGSKDVSRIVQFSDLNGDRVHFGKHVGFRSGKSLHLDLAVSDDSHRVSEICVILATAIFDAAQTQEQFSLPPFYAKEWKQQADGTDSDFVARVPKVHRPASLAARFLVADMTTKEFMQQLNSWQVTLPNRNQLLVGGVSVPLADSPSIRPDGERAIAVHHSGQVSKVDFSHNQIVFISRTSVPYFCDGEAVRQPSAAATISRNQYTRVLDDPDEQFAVKHDHEFTAETANLRDVWTIGSEPLDEKHYAAFPTELVHRCLKAGTSAHGYCPACGAPWVRKVIDHNEPRGDYNTGDRENGKAQTAGLKGDDFRETWKPLETVGWNPSCRCGEPVARPGLVLDPFAGSGRTGIEAGRLGLNFIGVELNPEYVEMSERLLKEQAPLFR